MPDASTIFVPLGVPLIVPLSVRLLLPSESTPLVRVRSLIVREVWRLTPAGLYIARFFGPPEKGNSISVVVCNDEPIYANVDALPHVIVPLFAIALPIPNVPFIMWLSLPSVNPVPLNFKIAPESITKLPLMIVSPTNVTPAVLLMCRLLSVAVPEHVNGVVP